MSHPTYQSDFGHCRSRPREQAELNLCVVGVRAWMLEVSQFGIPRFGETATRLRPLRDWLDRQVQHKHELMAPCIEVFDESPLVTDGSQQPPFDCEQVLDRLDDLIRRLNQTEPSFRSWQEAMDEVECLLDELRQHEESDAEKIARI